MKNQLRIIHRTVKKCNKCKRILKDRVLPRSGFPSRCIYKAVIIGAEPGPRAKGLMIPTEYEKKFMPGAKNTNTVRYLFEDLKSADIEYREFFYTNAVKCPAKTKSDSRKCFDECETYLKKQLMAINPQFLVVFGSAAKLLRLKVAKKNSIEMDTYEGFPAIIIRHPQGASKNYRMKVTKIIKGNLK